MRRTHGRSHGGDRTYKTWIKMRERCLKPHSDHYKWYGARGITICDRWSSFDAFLEDMGERPECMSLDRIDNDGPYCKDNCRWATQTEQTRKRSMNKLTHIREQLIAEYALNPNASALARKHGLNASAVWRCVTGRTWR